MAATSNQDNSDATFMPVVNTQFCFNSPTTFTVRKKPPVPSHVGGIWIIQDSEDREKFKLEELAPQEPGLAPQEPELAPQEPGLALKDSDGNPILTVKPQDTMQWNVFLTMEPQPLFTVETSGDYSTIEVSLTDYKIEGSFAERTFKISHISRGISRIAAEVKLDNQVDGIEINSVYTVEVKTGYDQAFIFGLVAVFEQIRLQ